jgi:hypothetical protein
MSRSRRNKLIIGVLIIMFVLVPILFTVNNFPFFDGGVDRENPHIPSIVTAEIPYNVTYANISYGSNTTTIWETGAMNISDGTNASFLETQYTGVAVELLGDTETDNESKWVEEYRFKNIENVSDAAIGTHSVRAQMSANNGEPTLRYDNGTGGLLGLDTSQMNYFNTSVKASASGSTLHEILFHHSAGVYYYLPIDQALDTTWVTLSGSRADAVSVGGMTATDSINWIDYIYTSPAANRWMYVDCPIFWNTTSALRLSVSFNFTGIAAYDHYTLNVSAASNVTTEQMQISNGFAENAVYDIDSTTWDNFTILLNTASIVAATYFVVSINSTELTDLYNSTLDIDLFQVYAWNETNAFPVVNDALLTNPDDTDSLYAGYRNYIFTLNISDADGVGDVHYASIGLRAQDEQYYWKAGFFEDNKTFIEELYPGNITLNVTGSSFVNVGNFLNLTFAIIIEVVHSSVNDMTLCCFVNDTESDADCSGLALDYRVEVNVDILGVAISDDRGDWSNTLFVTGTAIYYNSSNVPINSDYYDMWSINLAGMGNESDAVFAAGAFNITDIYAGGGVGLKTYYIGAKVEGAAETDPCVCIAPQIVTYIVDELYIIYTRILLNPADGERVYMTPIIKRYYDDTVVNNYDIVIQRDGIVWRAFDESNYTTEFWDTAAGGESHYYEADSVVDNTYGTTDFDDIPIVVVWYGSHGGGGDDDGGEDAWFDFDWFDFPPMEDAPELYLIAFLILALILFGCIVCPICTRCCRTSDRVNPFDYMHGRLDDIPFIPLILVGKKKKKKKKPKRKFRRK